MRRIKEIDRQRTFGFNEPETVDASYLLKNMDDQTKDDAIDELIEFINNDANNMEEYYRSEEYGIEYTYMAVESLNNNPNSWESNNDEILGFIEMHRLQDNDILNIIENECEIKCDYVGNNFYGGFIEDDFFIYALNLDEMEVQLDFDLNSELTRDVTFRDLFYNLTSEDIMFITGEVETYISDEQFENLRQDSNSSSNSYTSIWHYLNISGMHVYWIEQQDFIKCATKYIINKR